MRLTCPACGAQYEVPAEVIPADGRDVQCSSCSKVWFQLPATASGADRRSQAAAPESDATPPGTAPDAQTTANVAPGAVPRGPETPPQAGAAKISATDAKPDKAPAPRPDPRSEKPAAEPVPDGPVRRKLDPNVAGVLRAEAELEARARRNELAGGVESQPELGLEAAAKSPARMPDDAAAADTTAQTAPRDRLPDVREINSTLRANEDRPGRDISQTAQTQRREKRHARFGFTLMVLLAALLVLIYAFAPQIAQSVPETDPWLSAYVAQVDTGRVWLDAQLQTLLNWLEGTDGRSEN